MMPDFNRKSTHDYRKANRYGGACEICGEYVPAQCGKLDRGPTGLWIVLHDDCRYRMFTDGGYRAVPRYVPKPDDDMEPVNTIDLAALKARIRKNANV